MKHGMLVLFLLIAGINHSQNLIPNPGFEQYIDCPEEPSQIDRAFPWLTASPGTPDFFHACSSDDQVKVPYAGFHFLSYQPARTGEGMGHLCIYTTINMAVSEYMQTELKSSLVAGTSYYIEFYVSPDLDSSPQNTRDYSDAVGLGFTTSTYYEEIPVGQAISIEPAIEHYGQLITDTVGWTRVSGCYIAKGDERIAIIGNFRNVAETNVSLENPNSWPHSIYCYIEDVLVEAFDPLPDTLLVCDGESKQLNASFHEATYVWNTGETDSLIQVNEPGLYTVEASLGGCKLSDTVLVIDGAKPKPFPEDTSVCTDSPITLYAPVPGTYTWSDGSTGSQLHIATPGTYAVSINNECGHFEYSANVTLEDCHCGILVPNIFSPNGDGINDEIAVSINCDFPYQLLTFQLFDRWGSIVFNADAGEPFLWSGDINKRDAQTGIYVWQCTYQVTINGHIEQRKDSGDIMLVR